MEPNSPGSAYHTYLLRYWRVQSQSHESDWRFMLIHPYTNARRTFPDLAALTDFLQAQIGAGEVISEADISLSNQIDGESSNELREQ